MEKERLERQEKKRLERERKEKEKLERLEQERIERERLELLEKEKREKIRLATASEFDTPKDAENRRNNKQRFINIEKDEKQIFATTPKYEARHKFRRFVQNPEEEEIKKEDIKETEINILQKPIKNLYITKNHEIMQRNHSEEEINKEEIKTETRHSKILSDSNRAEDDSINRKMIYQKKIFSRIDNEDKKEPNLYEENKYVRKFKDIVVDNYQYTENEKDEEDSSVFRKKNLTVKHNDTLVSNLSESYLRGSMPTKIKIYRCVIYKNLDPNVNEDTIKNLMRRSGSQIFTNGGFIVKLPQNKTYKPKHGFI